MSHRLFYTAYTQAVGSVWPDVREAAQAYDELARLYERIVASDVKDVERAAMFREAKGIEERAIDALKKLVRETTVNRLHDVGLR